MLPRPVLTTSLMFQVGGVLVQLKDNRVARDPSALTLTGLEQLPLVYGREKQHRG